MTWKILLLAIATVESGMDPDAVGDNGAAFGVLQIHAAYVQDANEVLGTDYDHQDAFDPDISLELFLAYMSRYATEERLGRPATAMDIARIHNGGPNGWKQASTLSYWEKVKTEIESLTKEK